MHYPCTNLGKAFVSNIQFEQKLGKLIRIRGDSHQLELRDIVNLFELLTPMNLSL